MTAQFATLHARAISTGLVAATLLFSLSPGAALADDWVAEQLRGRVFVQTDGEWVPLVRGDVVSDNSPIQSTASGRATFTRDGESIRIGGETIIQIVDLGTSGQSNTIVQQQIGTVTVEAEVRQVQHFRVETPFLAAVVKGTVFTVESGPDGSEVFVDRGRVEVRDDSNGLQVEITRGQSAGNRFGQPLAVEGTRTARHSASNSSSQSADNSSNSSGGNTSSGGGENSGGGNGGGNSSGNGGGASANVSAGGGGGVSANANVGGSGGVNVGVNAGGGNGVNVNVNVGGIGVGLGLGR